jgi:hypothetical protein
MQSHVANTVASQWLISGFCYCCFARQLKSSAHQAADQLRALLKQHGGSDGIDELLMSPVPQLLAQIVRDGPGMPAAGSAMHVLAVLALRPDGRARLRVDDVLPAVVKYVTCHLL